jgi:hypothetical protein
MGDDIVNVRFINERKHEVVFGQVPSVNIMSIMQSPSLLDSSPNEGFSDNPTHKITQKSYFFKCDTDIFLFKDLGVICQVEFINVKITFGKNFLLSSSSTIIPTRHKIPNTSYNSNILVDSLAN